MLQVIRAELQKLLSHYVFGNMQIFLTNAKGFESEEKVMCGRDIEKQWDAMGWEFAENEI